MSKSECCAAAYKVKRGELRKWYCEYNEQYFGSKLATCNLDIVNTSGYLGLYSPSRSMKSPTIYLSLTPKCAKREYWTEQMLREVLLHEMVHYYVEEVRGRRVLLFCHGYKFRKVCRMLRKKYGARVFVSGYRYKTVPPSLGGKIMWGLGWLVEELALLVL